MDEGVERRLGGQVVDAEFLGETLYAVDRYNGSLWRLNEVDGRIEQLALDLGGITS